MKRSTTPVTDAASNPRRDEHVQLLEAVVLAQETPVGSDGAGPGLADAGIAHQQLGFKEQRDIKDDVMRHVLPCLGLEIERLVRHGPLDRLII
jgi:hypothetical protein